MTENEKLKDACEKLKYYSSVNEMAQDDMKGEFDNVVNLLYESARKWAEVEPLLCGEVAYLRRVAALIEDRNGLDSPLVNELAVPLQIRALRLEKQIAKITAREAGDE